MFLEYEKSGNLDDIVLFQDSDIVAYQVKYAVNPLDVYEPNDLIDPSSPVSMKKFADSWMILRKRFPDSNITACLRSNRGLDSALVDLVDGDGRFTSNVIENRRRGDAKRLRADLATASNLDADVFSEFLASFRFDVRHPTLNELEQHIRTMLLDKALGLLDDTIIYDLKESIKQNAILSREPITSSSIDNLLESFQSKLLIPQVFPVNRDYFIEQKKLTTKIDQALQDINSGYLVVTGLPGSGKSTSLTSFFDALNPQEYEVFRYYCFVNVNDNAQRMRVQADSLRANLLNEFRRRYPHILNRRFDFSEQAFLKALQTLAEIFVKQGRKFIIFLDGLDHAERLESEIRDTVISALPPDISEGTIIVVGTQELHKWPYFLKQARESPNNSIEMPLFNDKQTRKYLVEKRQLNMLSQKTVAEVYKKSEGLPLYLQYAAEIIASAESPEDAVESLSPAKDGDICNYYGLLWEEFEQTGMEGAQHLCAVMACLRFSVHRDELYRIARLDRPAFENGFKFIRHFLRDADGRLTVFHNSFREYVIGQVADDWVQEIMGFIVVFLKDNKHTPRWFKYIFEYCHDVCDYDYVLAEVNAEFVNRSLLHCRPDYEIMDSIHWAVESAFNTLNIVQLSRLGALRYRTAERIEHNLDRTRLASALLALGREQDVMTFAYSQDGDHWIVEPRISLAVISRLADEGKLDLGNRLFDVFTNEFTGIDSNNRSEIKTQVIGIARCLGIYAKAQVKPLRWLSRFTLKPDSLEQKDLLAPYYAPHLDTYIDALVKFGHTKQWKRLKRVNKIFSNNTVRYSLIRALARNDLKDELSIAISEYCELAHPINNIELAFYAVQAGMPVSDVTRIAGTIEAPCSSSPDYVSLSDPRLMQYMYSFVIAAYEDNNDSYAKLEDIVGTGKALWTAALRFLLNACRCIGYSFRTLDIDWYKDACTSIHELANAEQGEGERICESIELIRSVLPRITCLLTKQVLKRFPERLDDWIDCLKALRNSSLWNTHFGISESREDYGFELMIWEALSEIPTIRRKLAPVLRDCASTYEKATMLKGGSRSDHFMWLSEIMAKCGMREDAEKWLNYGINSSLIYGYHKDVTLLYLLDVLKLVNKKNPELAFERCARIFSMVAWMPHLTDGRETKWFVRDAFEAVLDTSRRAAFDLLKHLRLNVASWKMQDCLEKYTLEATGEDPEYLWCLTECFANHFSDDGRHCKQIMGTRQHIVDLVGELSPGSIHCVFKDRFRQFVLTEITPRHWPEIMKHEFSIPDESNDRNQSSTDDALAFPSKLMLDGKQSTKENISKICRISFSKFLETINKLKSLNKHFYDSELIELSLRHHITTAATINELMLIRGYVETKGRCRNSNLIEQLAVRFVEMGDQDSAIACLGLAYTCYEDFFRWRRSEKYLSAVADIDSQIALELVLKECYKSASHTTGGYDTPPIAAAGLNVLNRSNQLEDVFNDYLVHCESMFAQLPRTDDYKWLADYSEPSRDENLCILNFVIDELDTSEIDHAERIVRALTRLAGSRAENVIPIVVERTISASGKSLRRLLNVLQCLAASIPEILVLHQQAMLPLLERDDYFCRQSILCIFHYLDKASTLEKSVAAKIKSVEIQYSDTISFSTYRLTGNSSPEFASFLHRKTLFSFSNQLELIEKILSVPSGTLIAAIEKSLHTQGWSLDAERLRLKDDWYGQAHPQGWPIVWITTRFQESCTDALWGILNEAVEKLKLSDDRLQWLWYAIQTVDIEYVLRGVDPRPADIHSLEISDKDVWFSELAGIDTMQILNAEALTDGDGWITVYEKRRLAQDEKFNVPYRQEISLEASLIQQQVYGCSNELDDIDFPTEPIVPAQSMAVALNQARDLLIDRADNALNESDSSIPLVAEHENPLAFTGYWSACTLASFIIHEFNLSFEGFNLVRDGVTVARYEAWQEGYEDESYTREKLSFGVRLRVRQDLLAEICNHYRKILCIRTHEKREIFESIYTQKPSESNMSKRYTLLYLG